jgi:hypothetical protein
MILPLLGSMPPQKLIPTFEYNASQVITSVNDGIGYLIAFIRAGLHKGFSTSSLIFCFLCGGGQRKGDRILTSQPTIT